MLRTLVAASLLAAASPLAAQAIHSARRQVAALRDAALEGDRYAWDITEGLTTEVGPRLAGTDAEARARDWAVKKLTAMGFANVRVEPFDMPVWVRGQESAEILAPFPQPMVVAALGNSGSTGPGGITGEIVAFDSVDALARRAGRSRPRQDRIRRPSHDRQPRTAPATASSAPRAAKARPSPARRARSASSSVRSAPTITATRTPAS